ncbi:MAG TPA: polyprenyl synthetase family protein [Chloroflexia bacterium]|nr:polyprenyl synthetase family protein [Chloroflexia bacterium]
MSTSITSNLNLKQILGPVSTDIAKIDDVLRSIATVEYPLLRQGVEAIIAAGGKRLRPAILFLVATFNKYDIERLLPMSAAIELLHTATLVHDDTIDRALMRRGLPTLNSFIDEGTTVLAGDYLFAKSAVLSTMGGVQRATRIFAEALVAICEGELEQKFSTRHLHNSLDLYYKRIYSKTAALFAAAAEIGAVLSEAPEDEIQRFRHYGRQLGMAFQIVDDILDFQSSSQELGKPSGADLRQGTVTLPTMLYLTEANAQEREAIRLVVEDLDRSDSSVEVAINKIALSGALVKAFDVARQFTEEAKASISTFPPSEARKSLLDLADFAVERTF